MTHALFVFGTLRFLPLLEIVLGRTDAVAAAPACLPGFSVSAVSEGPFPTIHAAPDANADGLLITGLTPQDVAALDFYEGAFDYRRRLVTLDDGQSAEAYFPPPEASLTPRGAWSLDDWVRDWSAISLAAATEVMTYRNHKTPLDVGRMFPMIRARAASKINAKKSRHGAGLFAGSVTPLALDRVHAEFFALDTWELTHSRFDGTMSPHLKREVFLAPDAALVLPYDPVRDCVLLVEQFRMGPLARGDRTLWQLEPIAGRMDAGEAPQEAARREAREEAGLEIGDLLPVGEVYASPGTSSEFFYVFVGLTDLPQAVTGLGGLAAEDEDIRSHLLGFDALMTLCDSLQVANAPLALAGYWLARHRDRLRASGTFP